MSRKTSTSSSSTNPNNNPTTTTPSRLRPNGASTPASSSSRSNSALDQPRPRPSPSPSSSNGALASRRQSNVGAKLLSKRQSVSYNVAVAGIGAPLHVPPSVPALPSYLVSPPTTTTTPNENVPRTREESPAGVNGARAGSPASVVNGNVPLVEGGGDNQLGKTGLDVDMLASENFKAEEFLKEHLTTGRGNTLAQTQTDDLKQLRTRLGDAMKITEGDLQRSVFRNYPDFVVISKEIAALENEMLELKSVLEEWRTVPESLEGEWGGEDLLLGGSNRRNHRNSLADLATLYKTQLTALWERVEGSQKFVPSIPGRHLVAESGSFIELNAATYKPKQQVHLFLLNDAMLVSVKKKRGTAGGKVRLVAERAFNLSEIIVVDLKDGGELSNAVKIKRSKETIIFRTEKAEDKKALLMAFKKVAEELMNKKRKELLNDAESRKGDFGNLRGTRGDYDGHPPGFSPSRILGLSVGESNDKDFSWIGDFSDELSVAVATRSFADAVALVEKGKVLAPQLANDPHASVLFRSKLDLRTSELVTALLQELADPAIRKTGVVNITSWLLRLGQGERAREIFLTGRGALVRKRTRQIKFEGDISMYISELAMVSFNLIKNTCEWYMAAFKDNTMASGFVRWASEQVEIYAQTFRRQVYGADQDGRVIEESLQVTKAHGSMLRDVGLDFTFLLDDLLRPESFNRSTATSSENAIKGEEDGMIAVAKARQSIFVRGSLTA